MISSGMRDDDDGVSSDGVWVWYGTIVSYPLVSRLVRLYSYLVPAVPTDRRTICFTPRKGREPKLKNTDIRKQKTENSTKYPDRFGIMLLTDLFTVLTSSWHRPGTILCTLSFSISIHSSQFRNNLIFCKQKDDEICRQGPY